MFVWGDDAHSLHQLSLSHGPVTISGYESGDGRQCRKRALRVIIPCLDEELAIGQLVASLRRNLDPGDRIIVVDNASRDRTAEVASAAGAEVVSEPHRGYGRACLAGVRAAENGLAVFLDGDGADRPEDLNRVVAPVRSGSADLVVGARRDRESGSMAVPFVFVAALGAARASWAGDRVLLLSGLVPMLCKEDGALVSLSIGFLGWAVFRRRAGLLLMPVALVYGLVVTTVAMPAIRGGQPGDLIVRYSYLGSSVPGILLGLVTHPQLIVLHVLSPGPLTAVALMLGGVAFLPLARPLGLLAALPPMLLALLSQHWQQATLLDQYGHQPGPLVFVAALLGWVRLSSRLNAPVISAALLASTLIALVLVAPRPTLGSLDKRQAAADLANAVPSNASLGAGDDLMPMLAERDSIGLLPARGRDWIAVDASMESAEFVAGLPGQGYVLVGRWGELSLWQRRE